MLRRCVKRRWVKPFRSVAVSPKVWALAQTRKWVVTQRKKIVKLCARRWMALTWSLSLRVWAADSVTSALASLAGEVSVRWHLLTRPDLGSSIVSATESEGVLLQGIPLADITPFVVLVARDVAGNERRTIAIARLLDDVESRHDAIIARQLTDRSAFVRLLTLLLELSGAWTLTTSNSGVAGFFGTADASATGAGLFEALVRAVGDGHHGLVDARRIIDYLREHDEDTVLPDGFDELWSQVWSAHVELTGGRA